MMLQTKKTQTLTLYLALTISHDKTCTNDTTYKISRNKTVKTLIKSNRGGRKKCNQLKTLLRFLPIIIKKTTFA